MTIFTGHFVCYDKNRSMILFEKVPCMEQISKTEFKAHALEVLREIEQSGKSRIITDHGKPTIEIKKLRQRKESPLEILKGTVLELDAFDQPVAADDWQNA
jgi:antitoxin (DNA-binding transcriptional repressor) of toxin-antitoxin stability system